MPSFNATCGVLMLASDVPTAQALLQRRAQLRSRMDGVSQATTLVGMTTLITGTGLDDSVLDLARKALGEFLANAMREIEDQLAKLDVKMDVE